MRLMLHANGHTVRPHPPLFSQPSPLERNGPCRPFDPSPSRAQHSALLGPGAGEGTELKSDAAGHCRGEVEKPQLGSLGRSTRSCAVRRWPIEGKGRGRGRRLIVQRLQHLATWGRFT